MPAPIMTKADIATDAGGDNLNIQHATAYNGKHGRWGSRARTLQKQAATPGWPPASY
jgi:hypothetical protein